MVTQIKRYLQPEFLKMNIGDMLTLASIAVVSLWGYRDLQNKTEQNAKDILSLKIEQSQAITELRSKVSEIDLRTVRTETDVKWVREWLERADRNGRTEKLMVYPNPANVVKSQ